MARHTVDIPDEVTQRLRVEADRSGRSVDELMLEAIACWIRAADDPLFTDDFTFDSGRSDLSTNHDDLGGDSL